ncbi:MAG TPA: N-acetyltransferase, partial [Pyrodictium sp.]|nr:N-acetyltransferase [Pyrodictium sp.]
VGDNTNIQSQVYLPHLTRVGNNVFIGPAARVTNDKYPVSKRLIPTIIEDNVIIGAAAVLLPGVRVGEGAVVAAGALVTRDVKPSTVVAGAPAREIYTRGEYEERRRMYENKPG